MNVTRLLAKHGSYKAGTGNELTDAYVYETWVPQLRRYASMRQVPVPALSPIRALLSTRDPFSLRVHAPGTRPNPHPSPSY